MLELIKWQWEEGSVLYKIGPYTATNKIFEAVCREVCRYYSGKENIKTYKRKFKWTGKYLNCTIAFNTAHWNTSGRSVCFDPSAVMYSNDITGMERKGLLKDLRFKYRSIFNVYEIDQTMFYEIIAYIDEMLDCVRTFDSYDGFKRLMEEHPRAFECVGLDANGRIFLDKIKSSEQS